MIDPRTPLLRSRTLVPEGTIWFLPSTEMVDPRVSFDTFGAFWFHRS
jgi:hypothetical protein